jgi:deazaflavin-dependent oxidoreductase (nitroreductase family)
MPDYIPSPREWVRDQVELYERSGGTDGTTLRDTGLAVVIVTHTGNKTGAIRKTPLMRVKDGANYVLVGSVGGAPTHPVWVHNLRANPPSRSATTPRSRRCGSARSTTRWSGRGCGRSPSRHIRRMRITRRGPHGGSRSSARSQEANGPQAFLTTFLWTISMLVPMLFRYRPSGYLDIPCSYFGAS